MTDHGGGPASNRMLIFVNHAEDAPPQRPIADVVVLDTAWTPPPDARADMHPIREVIWSIIAERNVYDESLAALDDWADRSGLVHRLTVDGASWWYHIRGFLRLDLHELVLWRHALERLAPAGKYRRIEVPRDRPLLFEAARAGGRHARPDVVRTAPGTTSRQFGSGRPSTKAPGRTRNRALRLLNRARNLTIRWLGPGTFRRRTILRMRMERLRGTGPDVLAVVRGESFHVVRGAAGERRADPYVSPVLDALEAGGGHAAVAMLGLSHANADDWAAIAADERSLPISLLASQAAAVRARFANPDDLRRRLAGVQRVRLDVAGGDLGPALADILGGLGGWFARQQRDLIVAERLLRRLRPRALLTGWEASRTAWLAAARRHGIPSVAIQHGVIYRGNPDYYRELSPALLRPDLTCVFGAYERDLLIDECGYDPGTVIATGSPRMGPEQAADAGADAGAGDERAEVRRELGIEGDDRILVISGARHTVGEELHSITILANLLNGPLPGVHLVIKLHPEEEQGEHYRVLVSGLAAAGGYEPPPVTIVRDIDLYRLLRAADAHLGIYSTVLTDAVLTATPNMVAVGQAWADLLDYAKFGVAVPVRTVDDVRAFMRRPRKPTAAARARFLREHYEPGDAATRIAEAIAALVARTGPTPTGARAGQPPRSTIQVGWRVLRRAIGRRLSAVAPSSSTVSVTGRGNDVGPAPEP